MKLHVALLLCLLPWTSLAGAVPRTLILVSWNVENLFDPLAEPDNEWAMRYSPAGAARWTEARYRQKLANLAETLGRLRPDILCLQEVERRSVLRDIQQLMKRDYALDLSHILHQPGGDLRGMDVAILSRLAPEDVRWITPAPGRRDILMASFAPGGARLVVFNNHWKSRFIPSGVSRDAGIEANRLLRMREATALREVIDELLARDPASAIVVAGDFNDDADDPSLVTGARIVMDRGVVAADVRAAFPEADAQGASADLPTGSGDDPPVIHPERRPGLAATTGGALYNLAAELPVEERGTFYFHLGRVWNSFDSMAVSRGMLPEVRDRPAPWQVRTAGYEVIRSAYLGDSQGRPLAFRRIRRREDGRLVYQYGYSDHFPVRLKLTINPMAP